MMRTIALVHYRLLLRGGLETRLINYSQYLSEQGFAVTVICAKKSDEINLPTSVQIVILGLGLMPKPFRKLYFNFRLRHYMKKQSFDFSLSLERTYSQDAALAPSNHLGFLKALGRKGNRLSDWVQTYLDRKTYQHSKIIFACSKMIKDELIDLFNVDAKKIKVLPPPINLAHFQRPSLEEKKQLKRQFGMNADKKTFVFVSASHKRKGLPLLLEVFKGLENDNCELFIAGYPKLDIDAPNVHFVGFLNQPRDLYAAADFCIHPALYEPYGQIISESLQCGTPVIVSHMVGAKEIIDEKVGFVISDFNADTWAKTLKQINPIDFNIPEDYAKSKGLDLPSHVAFILESWKTFQTKGN